MAAESTVMRMRAPVLPYGCGVVWRRVCVCVFLGGEGKVRGSVRHPYRGLAHAPMAAPKIIVNGP
jgi:hypothetical protein